MLPVPSTFTVLPKVMAQSRGAPYCAFTGQSWKKDAVKEAAMPVRCFRRDAKTGQPADFFLTVEAQHHQTVLGSNFW